MFKTKNLIGRFPCGLSVLLCIFFGLTGCGLDVEDPNPPATPQWVQKSAPELWPEQGIDAIENGAIVLEWLKNTEDDIEEYHLYRTRYYSVEDSLGEMEEIAFIESNTSTAMSYSDRTAELLIIYQYCLRAEDQSQNLSEPSDTCQYRLLQHIHLESMHPNGVSDTLDSSRELTWSYNYAEEMQYYIITILGQSGDLIVRESFSPGGYIGEIETWIIPSDIALIPGEVYKWRIDTSGDSKSGVEIEGSESSWAQFLWVD